MDVLVLNAAYQPLSIIPWQDAIIKLHSEKAADRVEIVSSYSERFIRSAHAKHQMPSVVRHVRYRHGKKRQIKFSRDNVWARDRGRCQYCGAQVPRHSYTYDHVIPKCKGGKTTWENIVTACVLCNSRKRDMSVAEAKMKLRTIPVKPDYLPDEFKNTLRWKPGMPEDWKVWFGADYWHGSAPEESSE